jgi:hypothetical protein
MRPVGVLTGLAEDDPEHRVGSRDFVTRSQWQWPINAGRHLMEHETVVVSLRSREALRVHHELLSGECPSRSERFVPAMWRVARRLSTIQEIA